MARALSRAVLIRHGETLGESSVRFHGRGNVALSPLGLDQARAAAERLRRESFELAVASPLHRAWKTAVLVTPGSWVRLEADFREIDFGRWEGLTREEIAARDPALYDEWQQQGIEFDFPDGERRADFRARVERGLERILASDPTSLLVVAHKGVVRTLIEALADVTLPQPNPELGSIHVVERAPGGRFALVEG